MLAVSVGSKVTIIGLMLRPWIPPAWLIWLTKRWMALVWSPYSLSSDRPSRPAMLLSEMTGKTTLMAWAETPRVLVLAWLTGVTVAAAAVTGTSLAPAPCAEPGVPDGAITIQMTRPTTTARIISDGPDLHGPRSAAQAAPGAADRCQWIDRRCVHRPPVVNAPPLPRTASR